MAQRQQTLRVRGTASRSCTSSDAACGWLRASRSRSQLCCATYESRNLWFPFLLVRVLPRTQPDPSRGGVSFGIGLVATSRNHRARQTRSRRCSNKHQCGVWLEDRFPDLERVCRMFLSPPDGTSGFLFWESSYRRISRDSHPIRLSPLARLLICGTAFHGGCGESEHKYNLNTRSVMPALASDSSQLQNIIGMFVYNSLPAQDFAQILNIIERRTEFY